MNIDNHSSFEAHNFQTPLASEEEFSWDDESIKHEVSNSSNSQAIRAFIAEEDLAKIQNGQSDQLVIKLNADKGIFSAAIEKNTAVIIKKSSSGKPEIEISAEIQKLLDEMNVKVVSFESGGKKIHYQKADLTIGQYTKSSINEFALRFFQNVDENHKKKKREVEELQKSLNQKYLKPQNELNSLRNRKVEIKKTLITKKDNEAQEANATKKKAFEINIRAFFENQEIHNSEFRQIQKDENERKANIKAEKKLGDRTSEENVMKNLSLMQKNISIYKPL